MPEGHSIHRLAIRFQEAFVGHRLSASSPQGRFAQGAALIDGAAAVRAYAHGKHFFLEFDNSLTLNVHLGLYGAWTFGGNEMFRASSSIGAPRKMGEAEAGDDAGSSGSGEAGPPAPKPTTRLRLVSEIGWADLVGATTCRVLQPSGVAALRAGLGPDPLDPDADPGPFFRACRATSRPIGAVLMDQKAISGIGNIYRAESLFRAGLDPHTTARAVAEETLEMVWRDNVRLMGIGVELGKIVTTAPEHRPGIMTGEAWPTHANYVYARAGETCRVCGTRSILVEDMGGRKLYRCTVCQT